MAVGISRTQAEIVPKPDRWAVEVWGVKKRFVTRQGLPVGWGFGNAHWIISSLIKYRQQREWKQAVDGVDLNVERGELFGLLGPNGAGKTTLLKCLATLLSIDECEAFVNGYSVRTHPDEVRLSMNLVGSGHWAAFDWGMTVTQNLHFFGTLYGLSKAERTERIEHTLEKLGLTERAKDTPMTLSAGERQRLLLAKGFMIRTPVFFLDEPTVGLDPDSAREVRDFITRELIGRTGTSGILTTHRMDEPEALCSRIAIMNRGRVVACGTPLQLKQLAGEHSILEVRASPIPATVVRAVKKIHGVRAAATAPADSEGMEESMRVHCEDLDGLVDRIMDTLTGAQSQIQSYHMSYRTYIITGVMFTMVMHTTLSTYHGAWLEGYWATQFDTYLQHPGGVSAFLTGAVIFQYCLAGLNTLVYLLVDAWLFGVSVDVPNLPVVLLVLVLAILSLTGLGLIGASTFSLLNAKNWGANPVEWLIGFGVTLLSGVYFPPTALPGWLQRVGEWLPQTHALRVARLTLGGRYHLPLRRYGETCCSL